MTGNETSPFGLLGTEFYRQYNFINTVQLQKYHVNQYNYGNNNYIPELLMAYSVVVDGEFLLEWCENFGKPQVWYISYVAKPHHEQDIFNQDER